MAQKVILKRTDVDEFRKISPQFNDDRFNAFAFDVQQTYLRELLGDALYQQLYADLDALGVPQSALYTTLVNGETYTLSGDDVQYFGLKPYLSFHWLKKAVLHGDQFFADYGNIAFASNPQDNMQKTSASEKNLLAKDYETTIISYRNNIVRYLNDKTLDFPKWQGDCDNLNKSSFTFFAG
jgi:hypothetical protein